MLARAPAIETPPGDASASGEMSSVSAVTFSFYPRRQTGPPRQLRGECAVVGLNRWA